MSRSYTVSELARNSHVTVRALHHYDAIGLLVPSRRNAAGYRLYSEADARRLARITVLRELGFSLEATRELLAGDVGALRLALEQQRQRAYGELARQQSVLRAIENTLARLSGEEPEMDDMFEGFESFAEPPYAEEAKSRWGESESYRESARRTRGYSKEDWQQMKSEAESLMREYVSLLLSGEGAASPAACALAERYRLHIDRWFYPCSRAHHVRLGQLYVDDPRFTAHFEQYASGLAPFVAESIRANESLHRAADV